MPRESAARQFLFTESDGFSLHAAVRFEAHDGKRVEPRCRYIARPALSDERVQRNVAGQVEFKLNSPWRAGTTRPVLARCTSCSGWPRWRRSRGCSDWISRRTGPE